MKTWYNDLPTAMQIIAKHEAEIAFSMNGLTKSYYDMIIVRIINNGYNFTDSDIDNGILTQTIQDFFINEIYDINIILNNIFHDFSKLSNIFHNFGELSNKYGIPLNIPGVQETYCMETASVLRKGIKYGHKNIHTLYEEAKTSNTFTQTEFEIIDELYDQMLDYIYNRFLRINQIDYMILHLSNMTNNESLIMMLNSIDPEMKMLATKLILQNYKN